MNISNQDLILFAACLAIPPVVSFGWEYVKKAADEAIDNKLMDQTVHIFQNKLVHFLSELHRAKTTDDIVNIIKVTEYPFKAKAELTIKFPLDYIHGYGYSAGMESTLELQNDIRQYETIEDKNFERDINYIEEMVKIRLLELVGELPEGEEE